MPAAADAEPRTGRARRSYRRAALAERLLFDVPPGGTEDVDESMMAGAAVKQAAGKVKDALTGGDDEATERSHGSGSGDPVNAGQRRNPVFPKPALWLSTATLGRL